MVSKYWGRDIIHGNFRLILGNYIVIQTLFTNSTCWRICSPTVTYDWCPVNLWIVTGATCGAGDGDSFRNTWFQSLWNLLFLGLSLRINYSGLFALISLTAFTWTYFIMVDIWQLYIMMWVYYVIILLWWSLTLRWCVGFMIGVICYWFLSAPTSRICLNWYHIFNIGLKPIVQ